ncbi:MAG: hypothetical protein E2604_14170 [Flavobacterium sp.]|nr:hypothetical protein [Flavobacterium sp.]
MKRYLSYSQSILFFILLIFFSCSKNNHEIILNEENKSVLESILNTNDFVCKNDDFVFKLNVRNSKLKTESGREMGASIAALILYEEVVEKFPEIKYDTYFEIMYLDTNLKYTYSLQNLSDVINGQSLIEDVMLNLSKGIILEGNSLNSKKLLAKDIEWAKVKDISFGGFQLKGGNNKMDTIFYRVFLNSNKIELKLYMDKETNEILKVD